MLHKSPYIWIFTGLAAFLAIGVGKEVALAFTGVFLAVDGLLVMKAARVDLGDWKGDDSGYVCTGPLAQLIGLAELGVGLYLVLSSGAFDAVAGSGLSP